MRTDRYSGLMATVASAALALTMTMACPAGAQTTSVGSYDKIAEGGNGDSGFTYREVSLPSINSGGSVAFVGQNASRFIGVFEAPGAVAATTILTPGATGSPSALSINTAGTVAFSVTDTSNVRKVLSGNGGALTYVSDPATAPGIPNFTVQTVVPQATINDAGTTAYIASGFNSSTQVGSFYVGTAQNGTYTPGAQSTAPGTYNGVAFNDFYDSRINNAGQIAIMMTSTANQGYVFRRNTDGSVTTIASLIQPETFISMNDNGFVSYFGLNGATLSIGNGLTTKVIGTLASIDPVSGLPLNGSFGFNASVNNLNQVAFRAGGGSGGAPIGIYVGDGSKIITVAQVGQSLYGSTITALDLSSQSINYLGEVVFSARLANGHTEILRGTLPGAAGTGTAPEPGSLLLLVPGAVSLVAVGLRRRRVASPRLPGSRLR